jgi:predicted dehydrogenase
MVLAFVAGRSVSVHRRLKTAVVGAGVFGAFHAAKHAASPRAELVGIFDIDHARARALADRFNVAAYERLPDLLNETDAVTIASPAETHFSIARQALQSGRHVYVEKPLALSLREADALIALAEDRSLVLQVGHQERFVLAAMDAPRRDAAPMRLELARCGPPSGRGEDVSVVFDLMIHDLDIARMFGFSRPRSIAACGDRNETIATLTFDGGRHCSFTASRRHESRRRMLKATYEDGVVEIDFLNRRILDTTSSSGGAGASGLERAFDDPLCVSVDAFLSSALDGARTMVDGKAGRGALELALLIENARDAFNASSRAGRERLIA